MTKTKRILAGVTEEKDLYFLEVNVTDRNGYDEFTVTGFTVTPRTEEEKEEYEENYLDGEERYFWKQAVEADSTTLSLDDWIEAVRDEGDHMDCSLYSETVEVDNVTYYFESQSCGQHEEATLEHYSINKVLFGRLMKLWQTYHLKPVSTMTTTDKQFLDEVMQLSQDEESEVVKTVEYIKNN